MHRTSIYHHQNVRHSTVECHAYSPPEWFVITLGAILNGAINYKNKSKIVFTQFSLFPFFTLFFFHLLGREAFQSFCHLKNFQKNGKGSSFFFFPSFSFGKYVGKYGEKLLDTASAVYGGTLNIL